ncbi:MAG: ATP-binding protein [Chitinophagaceae bacterium]
MPKEKLELIFAIFSISAFFLLFALAVFALFRIFLKRKNTILLEKERMSIEFEQTLLHSKVEIQEETLNRVSGEIHDNIGQVLSLVRLNLNTIETATEEEKIDRMDQLMEKAINDLRNLSHSLDTDIISKSGWIKATERLFNDLAKTGTFRVAFTAEEILPLLSTEKSIILFRMIQEITNNIIKHAKAREIKFQAVGNEMQIVLSISDDGKGFDKATASAGAGLQNLENRAKLIGAKLYIHTEPGSGTTIIIHVNTIE